MWHLLYKDPSRIFSSKVVSPVFVCCYCCCYHQSSGLHIHYSPSLTYSLFYSTLLGVTFLATNAQSFACLFGRLAILTHSLKPPAEALTRCTGLDWTRYPHSTITYTHSTILHRNGYLISISSIGPKRTKRTITISYSRRTS